MRRQIAAVTILGSSLLIGGGRPVARYSTDQTNAYPSGPGRPVHHARTPSGSGDTEGAASPCPVIEGAWTPAGTGLSADGVYGVWVDPTDPLVLYAGGLSGSLFRSTNAGEQWTFAGVASPYESHYIDEYDYVDDLAIDPDQPTVIYAVAGRYLGSLYKSMDNGATWRNVSPDESNDVMAVEIDPHVTSTLYLADAYGVFKSIDAGHTWKDASRGINLTHGSPAVLAIDPVDPSLIYVGTWCSYLGRACAGGTIYRSTDGGSSWTKRGRGLGHGLDIERLVIDPQNTSNLYALTLYEGVYRSTDRGDSWRRASFGMQWTGAYYAALAIDPANPSTLYVGGPGGLFKSTDAGASWHFTSPSLWATWVTSVVVAPSSPSRVYVGTTGRGVNCSTDGGASWQAMNLGLNVEWVIDVASSPSNPAKLYASLFSDQNRMYTSTNSAESWTFTHGMKGYEPPVVVDPLDSARLWSIWDDAVVTSEDSGHTWAQVSPRWYGLTCVAVDPTSSSVIYAGAYKGVYKSSDGGTSWTLSSSGMRDSPNVEAVAIDPTHHMTIYAGTSYGVYKSRDGGSSWQGANSGLGKYPSISTIMINPSEPLTLYALNRGVVCKTVDGGASWKRAASGLGAAQAHLLVINPSHPSVLSAMTDIGLHITKDGARSWSLVRGAPSLVVTAVEFDPAHSTALYVGFGGCGLWKWRAQSSTH